jgi:hypothetical protein
MKTVRHLWIAVGFLGFGAGVNAQSVNWNNPGPVVPNRVAQLELVFTDCQPQGNVNLPQVNGLQILGQPGRATSFSMINFQTRSSTTLSYSVQVGQGGRIQIPSFEVQTDKGKKIVPSLALDATASAPPRQQATPSPFPLPPGFFQNQPPAGAAPVVPPSAVQAEAQAEPRNPFAGEVFDVNYRVMMGPGRSGRVKTTPLWDVQNFTAEAWDRGQQIGPGGSQGLQFHTRAMVPKAGKFELPAIRQKLDIDTPLGGRSFFFTAPGSVEVEASTEPVAIDVQPLPAGAPAGFKGAVGQFSLESRMVPEQVNEGEPITWTLNLKGTGNWPMGVELPSRTVPAKMRTIQPKLRREFDGTQVFTGGLVEDLVLIPTEAGEYELPAVKFVYFDPKKKAYETIEAKPPKISVLKEGTLRPAGPAQVTQAPAVGPQQKQGGGPGWGGFGSGRQAKVLQYGTPALPREPLEGTGVGVGPIPAGWIRFLAVLPWLVLAGVWWRWAQKRAVLTDPERSRKEALQSWKSTVQLLRSGAESAEMREKSLLVWQKSVAGTLGVDTATPAWPEISAAVPTLQENDRGDLEKCWLESDEALYGRNPSLNGDWCERAAAIANRIDLPPLGPWEPLRPRNLLPWFGLLLILALPTSLVAQDKKEPPPLPPVAEDPIRLYREGSFEKAGQVWGERVRKNLSDPVSRNNLGLAWFQIGDKERALANGLSAYLVSPQTATVDWNMMIFADAADQLDPAIRRLLEDTWSSWLTSRAGVFTWQLWLVAGSTVAALGAGLWLASGYLAWRRKLFFRLGSGVLLAGASLAFVAGTALGVYGKLANRAAVMVVDVVPLRSVPTEVQQTEKAYPPGSIARREKEFLGWSKVRMPNNDAGWIRTENLVPLY